MLHFRPAAISSDSVNCVSLDDEPENPCDRMMVAAYVGLNPAGKGGGVLVVLHRMNYVYVVSYSGIELMKYCEAISFTHLDLWCHLENTCY